MRNDMVKLHSSEIWINKSLVKDYKKRHDKTEIIFHVAGETLTVIADIKFEDFEKLMGK